MSKLSDVYVGVLDFFAILLPGAIATALLILTPYVRSLLAATWVAELDTEIARWTVFLTSAYLVGHLVFLIGSYIDPIFHVWRKKFRTLKRDCLYKSATKIRDSMLTNEESIGINTFQWARSVLMEKFPLAAQDVQRLEADSKFFRSLLVVCVIVFCVLFDKGNLFMGFIFIALSIGCVLKYGQRRLKSEMQAYTHIITLSAIGLLRNSGEKNNS